MLEIKDLKTGEIQVIDDQIFCQLQERKKAQEYAGKNQNFTQFDNKKLRDELALLAVSNKYAMAVFLILSSLSGSNNGVIVSQLELCEISGLRPSRISEGIAQLVKKEMIKKHSLRGGGSLFALNEDFVWKTKRSRKTLSLFRSANVVVSDGAKKVTRSIAIAINDISGKQYRPPKKTGDQQS